MAAWTRLAASVGVAVLALTGCTYSAQEPGLFPSPKPTAEAASPSRSHFPPQKTNPKLPVAGERIWVSGGQIAVTMRIAVHAVRRVEGATVLDWSVTPLSAAGFAFGDASAGDRDGAGRCRRAATYEPAVSLLDSEGGQVYRPLIHQSRRLFNHCLCTPVWRLAQTLRIGETRLLQIGFPSLPVATEFVDVSMSTLTPFFHVPVSPLGTAPVAGSTNRPRSSGRAADDLWPSRSQFRNPIQSRAGAAHPDQPGAGRPPAGPRWSGPSARSPISSRTGSWSTGRRSLLRRPPADVYLINTSPASGPVLLVPGRGGEQRLTASG